MMTVGRHKIRSHMALKYDFTGIRLQDSSLTPVQWTLKINLIAPDFKNKKKENIELQAALAYNRIYFWLDTNLPNVLMVDATNENDLYIANLSSNIPLYCPGDTGDDHLVQLLHSKISAIAGNFIIVGEIELKGSDTSSAYIFDSSDSGYEFPALTKDYIIGEIKHEIPWWNRNDGFCFEFIKMPISENQDEKSFIDIVDPMLEFERITKEESESYLGIIKEPAKIVQLEKWIPKKI